MNEMKSSHLDMIYVHNLPQYRIYSTGTYKRIITEHKSIDIPLTTVICGQFNSISFYLVYCIFDSVYIRYR